METVALEHINVTVTDPQKTSAMLCSLFDWQVRWQGSSLGDGQSIHVGSDDQYLAIYSHDGVKKSGASSYANSGGLNHIGVVVNDLDAMEKRVLDAGFETTNHADYEPGKRFYFRDHDNIEFEIISYA